MTDIGSETNTGLNLRIEVKGLSQDKLFSCMTEVEKTEFPETQSSNVPGNALREEAYEYDYLNHFYLFRPSHHVVEGLINPDIIYDLQENDYRLLSVGVGSALLEQLLIRRFGIRREAITLADINKEKIPDSFKFYQFDMFEEWPESLGKFNYIIFPQALIAISYKPIDSWDYYLGKLFSDVLDHTDEGGQVRLTGMSPNSDEHESIIKTAHERVLSKHPDTKLSIDRNTIVLSLP